GASAHASPRQRTAASKARSPTARRRTGILNALQSAIGLDDPDGGASGGAAHDACLLIAALVARYADVVRRRVLAYVRAIETERVRLEFDGLSGLGVQDDTRARHRRTAGITHGTEKYRPVFL